jgi:hypothetical protein
MGYDYSVSGNIAKITLLICFEKRGSEGEEGVEQAAKPYVSGGGRVEKSALVNRQLTANLVIGKRQIYTSGAHRG